MSTQIVQNIRSHATECLRTPKFMAALSISVKVLADIAVHKSEFNKINVHFYTAVLHSWTIPTFAVNVRNFKGLAHTWPKFGESALISKRFLNNYTVYLEDEYKIPRNSNLDSKKGKIHVSLWNSVASKNEQQNSGFSQLSRGEIEHAAWKIRSSARAPSIEIAARMTTIGLHLSEKEANDCTSKSRRFTTGPSCNVTRLWQPDTPRVRISARTVFFSSVDFLEFGFALGAASVCIKNSQRTTSDHSKLMSHGHFPAEREVEGV